MKMGIRYKNWGKKNDNFFHSFSNGSVATHYIPKLFSESVLNSGFFNVVEKTITDPDKKLIQLILLTVEDDQMSWMIHMID